MGQAGDNAGAAFHHSSGSQWMVPVGVPVREGAWGYFISGFLLGDLLFVPRQAHFSCGAHVAQRGSLWERDRNGRGNKGAFQGSL